MRFKHAIRASAANVALLSLAVAAQAQAVPADSPSTKTAASNSNEDIVVTASRRSERLRDVPSSITALDGATLEKLGARDASSYLALVPGVSLRDFGTPGEGTLIIRGLNSGSQQLTNTAATYIDDAPFSSSGYLSVGALLTPDPDIADLDRIEVLKGPQGTLYGANSLGGLVRIISKRPELTTFSGTGEIEGSTTDGGADSYLIHGSVNVPIVNDQLAIRVNGVYRRIGGFVDNVATGDKDANWSTIKGGRASLRWKPAQNLTIDLGGMLQDIHNNGASVQQDVSGTLTPLYGRYKYSSLLDTPSNLKYRLGTASVDYDMGAVSIIGTGSYAQYRTDLPADYSTSYLPYLRLASPLYAAALPADGLLLGNTSPNMNKWTGEIRAVSRRLGPVEFVAGGFYTDERSVYNTTVTAKDANGQNLSGNFLTGVPLANLLITTTTSHYKEIAGFLNGTFYITDNFDVGGGVRLAHNSESAVLGGPGAVTFYVPRATTDYHFKDTVATYLATVRYRPTSHISLYARAASGYRPGGPQTNSQAFDADGRPLPGVQGFINPDTTWNYEGGIKASFGKFSIDASGYHIDWKNIQLNSLYGGTVLGANGGDARVNGFELAMTARPGRYTTFSANVGYTDARMTKVDPSVQAYLGVVKGDRLPLTPTWTVNLIGDQIIPLSDTMKGDIGATVHFRADMPSSFPGATSDPNIQIPSLATVDLRAGVTFGRFGVQVRADNVFNAYGFSSASTPRLYAGQQVPTGITVIRPRTLSLAITAGF